jgi:AraC-like DNA-binding protein
MIYLNYSYRFTKQKHLFRKFQFHYIWKVSENSMDNSVNYITTCGKRLGKNPQEYGPIARDVFILHYIISGKGYLDFGDKHILVEKGQSFLIRPFLTVHYYSEPSDPWEFIWIDFRGKDFEKIINNIEFVKDNCIIGQIDPKYILPFADIIHMEYKREKRTNFCNNLLKSILGIYTDVYPANENNTHIQKFSDATKLISKNFQNPSFSTKDISLKLNISDSSLYRLFIEFAGISPNRYLTNYRITMAKNLIDSGTKINIAAHSCGFNDPLYFSRVFKNITSMSPKGYYLQSTTIDCRQETYVFPNNQKD